MKLEIEITADISDEQAGWILNETYSKVAACDPNGEVFTPQDHLSAEAQRQWDEQNPIRWT